MTSICIHAHFYQPTREDPWTGAWPADPTALPWRDWNERITDECYAPNAAARLLDATGRVRALSRNYEALSFDFGPTLLQWLAENRPSVLDTVVDASATQRWAREVGPSMAQGYHHAILPLCDDADLRTEIVWGLRDHARRFGYAAEGFWLPEAAVDLRTLEVLVAEGVRYVVLAPHQVQRVRPIGEEAWIEAGNAPGLGARPYRVALPSGATLAVYTYDGPLARAVAFEGALEDGEALGRRLVERALLNAPGDLLSVVTDGESYGHHHRYGEMALARALEVIQASPRVELTTFGAHLAAHPPRWEAEIAERTSWSCAHGLGRWTYACGCRLRSDTHQRWRAPLRALVDRVRAAARAALEPLASRLFVDAAAARDAYGDLVGGAGWGSFSGWATPHLLPSARDASSLRTAHTVLEVQRHLLAMNTSCGWFFDQGTGVETRQILRHAACAVTLVDGLAGTQLAEQLVVDVGTLPVDGDVAVLVDAVQRALVRPAPLHAPHVRATLDALAEEGVVLGPVRAPALPPAFPRSAGLLLPVSALPGAGPLGDLDDAHRAIDWMAEAHLSIWQVLPVCPPDEHGSPYSSRASLSGDHALLGLAPLVQADLLGRAEVEPPCAPLGRVDRALASRWKLPLLARAADRLLAAPQHPWRSALAAFVERAAWAADAALFDVLAAHHGGPWWTWPEPLRDRHPAALAQARKVHHDAIARQLTLSWFFERQWREVRDHAAASGIRLFGDLPLYVGHDSVDVWLAPDQFQLDAHGQPVAVAGVPPDAFAPLGQRWGSPLFDWDRMAADGFQWWRTRLTQAFTRFDVLRLDHFIGLVRYWSIPADAEDARAGAWRPARGAAMLTAVEAELGARAFVAEDLGSVGPDVEAVRDAMGWPGMRVLQFGLDAPAGDPHQPANHPVRSIAYLGTHDNDTTLGWWDALSAEARGRVRARFVDPAGAPHVELLRLLLHSPAVWSVLTAQDVVGLGSEGRLNTPGTTAGNWTWRLRPDALDAARAHALREAIRLGDRTPPALRRVP